MCPVQEHIKEDGKVWRFAGIWSRNRWEWNTCFFATQLLNVSLIGFYDAMGLETVEYIVKQHTLPTIFCSQDGLRNFIGMRTEGMA